MIKAVFFDLWDTLIYLEGSVESREKLKSIMGPERYEKYRKVFARAHKEPLSFVQFEKLVNEVEKVKLTDEEKHLVGFRYASGTVHIYPETAETLDWAHKNFKVALVSNCMANSDALLDKFDIRKYFDTTVMSYDVGYLKPDKEMFEIALQKLSLSPNEVVMVGDMEVQDMQGANSVGIKGILVDRKNASLYTPKIGNLLDLQSVIV